MSRRAEGLTGPNSCPESHHVLKMSGAADGARWSPCGSSRRSSPVVVQDDDRAIGVQCELIAHRTEQQALEAAEPTGTDDDEGIVASDGDDRRGNRPGHDVPFDG